MRLFEFLARAQQSVVSAPRTVDSYEEVAWTRRMPRHSAVHFAHWGATPEPGDEVGHIDRIDLVRPPAVGEALRRWLTAGIDDPQITPQLKVEVPDPDGEPDVDGNPAVFRLAEHPDIEDAYRAWLIRWETWAERERVDQPVREAYGTLFSMQAAAASNPEEKELVLAVGCLTWKPADHPAVRRHLLTVPVTIDLDPVTGTLHVNAAESADPLRLELDMLDSHLTRSRHIGEVRETARTFADHPLNVATIGELLQRVAHSLDPDGGYLETELPGSGGPARPEVTLAPAIVLRRRSHGLVEVLERIRKQLIDAAFVPEGILPLVDPDHRPVTVTDPTPGAVVAVDDEFYLPLPVNDKQLKILQQVDRHAQTLVQGPPGTGKTHTAAALLSHLLAQGKRVLVTAQTDRALKEVRTKLPEAIRPLSVAVVGASREDMADLKVAVNTISQHAIDFDADESDLTITRHLDAIDQLRRQRAQLHERLVDVRAAEVVRHERGPYRGTLAAIAEAHRHAGERYGWIHPWAPAAPGDEPPLTRTEIIEWLRLLRDQQLIADEASSRATLADPARLAPPADFAAAVTAEQQARAAHDARHDSRQHPAYAVVRALPPAARTALQQDLHRLADTADDLARRREPWMADALADVTCGRGQLWHNRAAQLRQLVAQAEPQVRYLGITDVQVTGVQAGGVPQAGPDVAQLVSLANHLREHLAAGGRVKLAADGTPVLNLLAAKPVKAARELFSRVRVDGRPPTTVEAVNAFLAWAQATRLLTAADRAWPATVVVPPEDTFQERLTWHQTELSQLQRVLALGAGLTDQEHRLAAAQLPRPQWSDLSAVRAYAALVDSAAAADHLARTRTAVNAIGEPVVALSHQPTAAAPLRELVEAVAARDVGRYAAAVARLTRLTQVRELVDRRDALGSRLRAVAPRLHDAVVTDCADDRWDERLDGWDDAWAWAVVGAWLADRQITDLNRLQAEIGELEGRIRGHVEELAAARAWRHAASPDRISGSARANLQQYGQLVRGLGKGTGKYAHQRRAEIRQAMDRCRPSVPVWIMPIYRIAEQLQVQPDMFDVVVVDEASQAGLAATFLQYLAPKIVVIGDDKQVSPSGVGVDQQHLRDLADQYLGDDPYRASWQDPKRSLFDEAKMRLSGLIPLTEHRRCVPEIINFSNRIAYEPENIRLIPVRQYGADRLEPIRPVHVGNGYVSGTSNKVNPPEAEAVVAQIVACAQDPRYDGLTFGVISLQGVHQAKRIERLLLEQLDPAEWERRELRCGDSADFQGSERDVVFLSMVAAMEDGVRIGAAIAEMYVQRYNVAASRAKDQMWVFHSVRLSDLGNPEDMRYQLLDYCYGVTARPSEHDGTRLPTEVPEDRRVAPFDSLFEQRVYNRLVAAGFTVVPQFEAIGYLIDLVVIGPNGRLAVECDGDAWHGPDRYEADMARQRELERCGWEFFRIPQSSFVVDEAAVLQDLRAALDRRGIRPSGWAAAAEPAREPVSQAEPVSPVEPVEQVEPVGPVEPAERDSDPAPGLKPYEIFQGDAPRAETPPPPGMQEAILAIVACEGPMTGERLQTAYVHAAGGKRVGRASASAINKVVTAVVRRGLLVRDNPLGESGVQPSTYRLAHQPPALPRALGPRTLEEVPPAELAQVMAGHASVLGWHQPEAVYRATLQTYGRKALTAAASARLTKVSPLARAVTRRSSDS
ncbi:AAA domain-containing protein [Solwaraspora sp. WMMA2065]|uniref:AAA domain-containing protein n=1 Tax=Solwaraspora sp. WMMA2065 TaxID=3015166 RepID=UPI00259AFF2F|nr:AAA domain-containing protein [Solwaraspora sp. WMMA2065]WJK36677.1 AAA domain-containing protein [Solwaraspora sp. WMMA2065]